MTLIKKNRTHGFPFFMDELLNSEFKSHNHRNENVPAVNIKEVESGFELELAAPGFKKEEFNLEVDNDTLIISSEHEEEKKDIDSKFTRREFSYTKFRRSFNLPENVDQNKISANYNHGVLQVSIPQKEVEAKKVKQIEIS